MKEPTTDSEVTPEADVLLITNTSPKTNQPSNTTISITENIPAGSNKGNQRTEPFAGSDLSRELSAQDTEAENDCLLDEVDLAREINEFHARAEDNEIEALLNAWECGVRLNQAFAVVQYGGWAKYLKENCPTLGLTTVWRYRRLAGGYSTVEELSGLTLSEAYVKLSLTKFQDESLAVDDEEESDLSVAKKTKQKGQKLFQTVVKASKKFDFPVTLSPKEKKAVRTLCVQLEDVCGQMNTPSILGVAWQGKLENDVSDWTSEEVAIFRRDFGKLQPVWEQIGQLPQAQEQGTDNPTDESTEVRGAHTR